MQVSFDNLWEENELEPCITINIGQVPVFGIGLSLSCFGICILGFAINFSWIKRSR